MALLTEEQEAVVEYICVKDARCCIVNAFAGTGKTTLLANLAKRRFEMGLGATLLLTYSSKLKEATRKMAQMQEGLYVESMHSLVRNILHVGKDCLHDKQIEAYLALAQKPMVNTAFLQHVTLIVLDEMQDLSPLYYRLVQQLRSFFLPSKISLVGVGDFFQWLFASLNGSTPEYMCHPEDYFDNDTFRIFALTLSFRLTPQMCEWINTNLDPRKIAYQYPLCWGKYGASITKYWGDGLRSAKCRKCAHVHIDEKCSGFFDTKSIKERDVSLCIVNTYTHILPPHLAARARSNALVMVNGFQMQRFAKQFPYVTSPYGFKGCETKDVIVIGFDSFTEEVCAQQPDADLEDWPLITFCAMYVSCTRASDHLFVVPSKSKASFFTMRAHLLNIGQSQQQTQRGTRTMSRLFEFVPLEDSIENKELELSLQSTCMTKLNDPKPLHDVRDTAPGIILHTILRGFSAYYHRAMIIAVYLFFTRDTRVTDWTSFIKTHSLKTSVSEQWKADETWCEAIFSRCVSLLQKSQLDIYGKCLTPFEYSKLKGIVHFTARWGAMIQVVFDKTRKALHEAMMNFLCFRKHDPSAMVMNCLVLCPLQNELLKLQLTVHPDYYMSRIVSRKKWEFLLDSSFSLDNLHARGVQVLEKLLHLEQEQHKLKKHKTNSIEIGGTPLSKVLSIAK